MLIDESKMFSMKYIEWIIKLGGTNMQSSKIKTFIAFVLLLVITLIFTPAVYSDSEDGWKGYGLYNISGSNISIINEDVSIELRNDKLNYNGEFLIRNHASTTVKAFIGTPVQGIEKITLSERNSFIKWRKRSFGSLQNEFSIENRVPQEEWWYVFGITLNPGETKLFNMKLEDVNVGKEEDIYTFSYFNDRRLGFSNQVEKASLYISFLDFQPYNIVSLQGIEPSQLGVKGDVVYQAKADKLTPVSIKYMDVTKTLLDGLLSSAMYKPREISLAFTNKNFNKVYTLCDEYIKNPNDSRISVETVQFIKAESLRRLQNNERYLSIVESLDYSKLNPLALKNKILMDRMSIYLEQQNQEKLFNIYKEFDNDPTESIQNLKAYVESSSAYGAVQINKDNLFKQIQKEEQKVEESKTMFDQWYQVAMNYKYTPVILFAAGLIVGLFLRRIRFKRKKKKSMYVYRM